METEQEISFIDGAVMRTAEVAENLNVVQSTIRKYSKFLEDQGYTFTREPSNNNGRLYTKQDQEILQEINVLTENKRMSIELATSVVLSRRQGQMKPSQQEAPRAPMLTDDEKAEKYLERMGFLFKQETNKIQEEMKVYFKKEMQNAIEGAVETALEKERQRHNEEIKLLREEFSKVAEVIEKDKKKSLFQRLFGG